MASAQRWGSIRAGHVSAGVPWNSKGPSPARTPLLDARKPCTAYVRRGCPGREPSRGHGIAWRSARGRAIRGDRSRDTSPGADSPCGQSRLSIRGGCFPWPRRALSRCCRKWASRTIGEQVCELPRPRSRARLPDFILKVGMVVGECRAVLASIGNAAANLPSWADGSSGAS